MAELRRRIEPRVERGPQAHGADQGVDPRGRARADDRQGEAESLREELTQRDVVVRDRGDRQQCRLVAA